jgi:hypothetical protein
MKDTQKRTFFGLPIYKYSGSKVVLTEDIKKLPFYPFWEKSALGSTVLPLEDGEYAVFLHDWISFSNLFIETGRHRMMPRSPK